VKRRLLLATGGAALLAGCSATRVIDALVPRDSYRARNNVAYGREPRQRLDVYLPRDPATQGAPMVVFFYGGSWTRGSRADYRFVGEALASHGVVCVIADYRLSPQVRYPVFLEDCAAAVRWAVDEAPVIGVDTRRIYLMGHSAGAYNAAMLALDARWLAKVRLDPARLAGWIGLAGPYDFLPIENPEAQVAFNWPDTPADTQPINHVSRNAPRALLMAAAGDDVVNPQRSTAGLGRRLQAAGASAEVKLLDGPGLGHAAVVAALAQPLRWLAPVLPDVLRFIGPSGVQNA
jgi:acetyl esterase/lipase